MTMDNVKPAQRITYRCGHVQVHGGNAADPEAVYAEAAGLMTEESSEELCWTCLHPQEWAEMKRKAGRVGEMHH